MQVEDCCQALLTQILPTIDEQREGICIDIGVGTFAFYCEIFAKLGFKTIAVEPLPINILKQLCSRYGVTLIEACVSEVSGIQTMHIGTFQGSQNLNLSSLESDWWGSSAKTAEVQSITLSQVLSSVDTRKVSCIKIDVEGAESRIIRQFISLSKSLLPNVVMFEYGGGDSKGRGQKGWSKKFISGTYECLEILKDCGYNSLIIIDSAKEAQEIILNLQSSNLDIYEIFPEVSIYGNIIAVRGIVSEKLKIDNILEICAKYKDETINSVDSKKSLEKTKKNDNQNLTKKHLENFQVTGEKLIIDRLIQSKQTVFDVGANIGSWTQAVLSSHSDIKIHLFEPVPQIYQSLLKNIFHRLETGKIFPNNLAIGRVEKLDKFYFYQETPTWSTLFRRFEVEKQYNIQPPQSFSVLVTSLDLYCQRWGINRINFLKIDVEGAELDVLQGCENLLQKAYIDYIQFEYGGTFLDAKITLKEVFDYLQKKRYSLFKITSKGFEYKPIFYPEYENYEYSNFLAINERFISNILGENPKMLDIKNLCQKYSIKPGGVIHIGAYEGKEVAEYQSMGVEKILFIEANPVVFERLQTNVEEYPNVTAVNCAINNIDGTVTMYLTSLDRRSSILPLKRIKEHYTNIKETNTIKVKSRRLDTLLQELELNPSEFNIINIDIQGAELLALEGATNLLQYIDAINTEVNYEELYEGCALIEEIDDFLQKKGLEKVATTTPDHPSWGDAFYVRKPVITMSTLGKNGRFANQLFQYAFLKIYAQEHNLRVETPAWIGQALFGSNDSPISRQLPVIQETSNDLALAKVPHSSQPFKNVDFWGYFQYNTKFYAPHKEYFRALFKPVAQIENRIQKAINRLHLKGKTIIGIHLHRGDYGYGYFFIAPCEWYKEWLKGLWGTLEEPVLFIASDELETVIDDFAEYNPVTSQQLGLDFPQAQFYPDFYILSQCDIVGISNSSFSFAACMLNEKGKLFFRPHLSSKKLIPFDPWNSETIFRDGKVEADKIMIKEDKSTEVNILEKEKLNNVSTKVLISFLATKNMYRETIISSQEVFCGPDCETTFEGQNYLTINTPLGEYDIGEIIQQLPQSQQPELLIVKADSTKGNFPVNLPRLKCPKLLICGNTQHLNSPLNTLVEYAKKEKFDFIMSDHKRHHLHYFKEAGFEKVFWVPGFNINPHPQQRNLTSKYPLTFVGQIGQFHPYRKSILAYLKELNFPLYKLKAPQKKAAEIYAESLINLNVSLNGDLNLRVFEVLS
ncbi:MAG: FkbM family methyltransferase, partial [Trichodesmium sp.]